MKKIILHALLLALCTPLTFAQAPDTLWTKCYGGAENDWGYEVQQTYDGGYIIIGMTQSFGVFNTDVYLIRTDANGDTIWTKTYGGERDDFGYSVQQTSDSGYIIVGWTAHNAIIWSDVYLIKTDANGDTLWTKTYGQLYAEPEIGLSVQETSGGGYIIAGERDDGGPEGGDAWLIKTDVNGDTIWTKTYNGGYYEYARSVLQTTQGGYIIAGSSSTLFLDTADVYVVKTDVNGDTLWTKKYFGTEDAIELGNSMQQTSDGGYIITGYTRKFPFLDDDVYLIKTAPDTLGGIEEQKVKAVKSTNFGATIFSGPLLLPEGKKCKVYDVTGRSVIPDKIRPGIYFIEVDGKITQKVVKVR